MTQKGLGFYLKGKKNICLFACLFKNKTTIFLFPISPEDIILSEEI